GSWKRKGKRPVEKNGSFNWSNWPSPSSRADCIQSPLLLTRRHTPTFSPSAFKCVLLRPFKQGGPNGVLPLAERVLRERGSRLPNDRTSSPPSGGEAETD